YEPEVPSGFDDPLPNLEVFLVGPPDLQAGGTGHPASQRSHGTVPDPDVSHVKELDVGYGSAMELRDHFLGPGSLDLEAVLAPGDRSAHRCRRGAVIVEGLDIVSACFGMKLNPVGRRGTADEHHRVF